jgi:hypothetical protein
MVGTSATELTAGEGTTHDSKSATFSEKWDEPMSASSWRWVQILSSLRSDWNNTEKSFPENEREPIQQKRSCTQIPSHIVLSIRVRVVEGRHFGIIETQ